MNGGVRLLIAGLLAIIASACRTAPDTTPSLLPLGAGPEVRFGAAGTVRARPSVVVRGRIVAVAWIATFGGTNAVYVAASADGGRAFRPPIRIATAQAIDASQSPRLFFESRGAAPPRLVVEWVERAGELEAVREAESSNGGATFERNDSERVRLEYTGASDEDPDIPGRVIAGIDAPGATNWRGVVDADGALVVVWDESKGTDRRIAMQQVAVASDGGFLRLPATPVTAWGRASRPAIAATTGGVIVAWLADGGGRSFVALRPIGLETLCIGSTTARAAMRFEWTPWPSRSRALTHHE